eukprot:Sspe_Gene.100163::Locus_74888_Transcript_1_1_Confidence_1.000_Length_962::g.100163::m.100163
MSPPLHVVSWNVAGWDTCLRSLIKRHGSLTAWVERHRIDILCLQEVKLSEETLEAKGRSQYSLPGYHAFFACCSGSGQRRGLNGVATFAREGLVRRACPTPLGSTELDQEGRCLMTDHGAFVIFNVYVPNSGNTSRLPYKMRFLRCLDEAMKAQRRLGKHVVLVGDLNIASSAADVHWTRRVVTVPKVQDSLLTERWEDTVLPALKEREVVQERVTGSSSGQSFLKWRVVVSTPDGRREKLGKPVFEQCHAGFHPKRTSYVDESGEVFSLHDEETMHVGELMEAMAKIAGVAAPNEQWRELSDR